MAEDLYIEVVLTVNASADHGTRIRILNRSPQGIRVVRDQLLPPGAVSVAVVQDATAQMVAEVMETFIVTRGVQLVLHD